MRITVSVLLLLLFFNASIFSNNVNITNISVTPTTIQFDISWNNSWNTAAPFNNWDGVWIFVKTQVCSPGSSPWLHADLSNVSANHSVSGVVLQVDAVTDSKGVFIIRSALGTGNIASSTVLLRFSNTYVVANTNFEVLGIEMVYIPQGSFNIGDGSSAFTQSYNSFGTNNTSPANTISSEATIPQDIFRNNVSGPNGMTSNKTLNATFPKGFNPFYCMKYEISQQQYVSFLNLLDFNQQTNRTASLPSSAIGTAALAASSGDNRNSIEIRSSGIPFSTPAIYGNDLNGNNVFDEAADGGNVACNYLSWDDLRAYLDWSALRPMTELEFEKICRGSNMAIVSEFPWASNTINQAISSSLLNAGQVSEVSNTSGNGLCAYNAGASSTLGPLRVGFAATSSTLRAGAGAAFYGVMDMGGNLWEQTFQCGWYDVPNNFRVFNSIFFNGSLGDGLLDGTGNTNLLNWGGGVGLSIVRGGNWEYSSQRAQTSDRFYVNSTAENATRVRRTGGRGVRQ